MTNPCPHSAAAEALFTARAKLGVKKYGTTLADAHLTPLELLQHLSEEIADALVYVEGLKAAMARVPTSGSPMLDRVREAVTAPQGAEPDMSERPDGCYRWVMFQISSAPFIARWHKRHRCWYLCGDGGPLHAVKVGVGGTLDAPPDVWVDDFSEGGT